MSVISIEARNKMITELNGTDFSGTGDEENPLVPLVEKDNVFELVTKIMIYASFFKAVMFFSYQGITASYNHDRREFSVDTDVSNLLKIAVRELFKGKNTKPTVVEESPLLKVIK